MLASQIKVVALLNHNGQMGREILASLIPFAKSKQIHLVVLHRPESGIDNLKGLEGVKARAYNLDDPVDINKAKLQDVNVVISALPNDRLGDQTKLVDALAGANNLSLFIPSDYGTYWTEEDLKIANLPWLNVKEDVVAHAKEKRVPTAVVKGGLFPAAFTFPGDLFGVDLKENKVSLYRNARTNDLPVTSPSYYGAATASLAVRALQEDLGGKAFVAVEVDPTGQNYIDALEAFHGQKPDVFKFTEEQWQAQMAKPGFAKLGAIMKTKWGDGNYGFGDAIPLNVSPKATLVSLFKQVMP